MPIIKKMKTLVILFADLRKDYMFRKEFSGLSALDLAFRWAEKIPDSELCFLTLGNVSFADGETSVSGNVTSSDLNAKTSENRDGNVSENGDENALEYLKTFSCPVEILPENSVASLFETLSFLCGKSGAERLVFTYSDLPFLNTGITSRLLETHGKYKAEYTFFDGLPYGFSPEILDSGTLRILSSLAKTNYKDAGEKKVSRSCIFDFIKLDINSFEVEVECAKDDLGLLRLSFDSGSRLNHISCLELFREIFSIKENAFAEENSVKEDSEKENALKQKNPSELSEDEIIKSLQNSARILKTVPSYYNIQISAAANFMTIFEPCGMFSDDFQKESSSGGKSFMPKEKYSLLLEKIAEFSPEAVINPGFFGEPLLNPDFLDFAEKVFLRKGFSLLVETDGINVTEELCESLKKLSLSGSAEAENDFGIGKISWIVKLDSFTEEMYKELHSGSDGFSKAVSSVSLLDRYFPGKVYPQFIRCVKNEDELEPFWRFWSEKENGSSGNVLVQKYSSFCGKLPPLKSADLSPLERNACYHLRRDFNILADGSVPLCRETLKERISGNAFSEKLEDIFRRSDDEFSSHLKRDYCEMCRKCDEYYTFNF